MLARSLTTLLLLVTAGCIGPDRRPAAEPSGEPVAEIPVVVPDPVGPPEDLANPVPDACEVLLERLNDTHPLLENLDSALAGQAARFENAIEELQQPAPAPLVQDCPTLTDGEIGNKEIIGAIEWLYMDPPGQHFRARIDSGVETSSLSASDIVQFERDSDDWVRFAFQYDPESEPIEFELPIKRTVLIRQPPAIVERRVVIELDIRLGQELQTTEFTLTDRSRMTYSVLLGRAFLMDLYILDVSRSYIHDRYEAP